MRDASGKIVPTFPRAKYYAPEGEGADRGVSNLPGQLASPGCRMEFVPPTAANGARCEHVDCTCASDGHWQNARTNTIVTWCE